MPDSSNDWAKSALAKGSWRTSSLSSGTTTVTASEPSARSAWAISQPTGPPPITTSRLGTSLTLVASRFVQGFASLSPGISGMSGSLPVASTTAWRASTVLTAPSGAATCTIRPPARRP